MGLKLIKFIFFGNYFIGLLAVALTVEATLQLQMPFNSMSYYAMLFIAPIVYYTYAYMGATNSRFSSNPRTQWYATHQGFIRWSQLVLTAITGLLVLYSVIRYYPGILHLPLYYWITIFVLLAVAVLYYGLVPVFFFNLNLRNTGWLKPFVIGFVWAATVNLLPLIVLKIERFDGVTTATGLEHGAAVPENAIWVFLFIKNWMFCTVNAIMFDMKDYAIDSNSQLKTFVVRIGLKKTIFYVLIPLLITGMFSLLIFAWYNNFAVLRIVLNLIPFVLTATVAWSMNKRKKIFYYLIVIDGLILLKALCGIAAMELIRF
ncbi:hypothetical protein ACSBL2_17675 [Pedobacter sp. AW31-3R]|uniref:hypothetical protein n=1 Tax=Pedobacter sp. AW31-3R TaxID=3445781 RepID=UPI003F9EFB00